MPGVTIDSLAYTAGDAAVYGSGEVYHGVGCGVCASPLAGAGIGTGGVTTAGGALPSGVYGTVGYVGYAASVSGVGALRLRGSAEGYAELAVSGIGSVMPHNTCVGGELACNGGDAVVSVVDGDVSVLLATEDSVWVSGVRTGGTVNSADFDGTAALGLAANVGLARRDVPCDGPVCLVPLPSCDAWTCEGESGGDVLSTGVVAVLCCATGRLGCCAWVWWSVHLA